MELVIFTSHYPYGRGEEFLESELRIAETYFSRITIVTSEKSPGEKRRYIPQNAKVLPIREGTGLFHRLLHTVPCLLRLRVWKEYFFACRTTRYSPLWIIRQLMIQENLMYYINRHRDQWIGNGEDTVYETYWLGTGFAFENAGLKGLKISRAHGGDCFFDRGYHPYRREALRSLDMVFPISEAGRQDILAHYQDLVPDLAKKVRTAHMGIQIPDARNPQPDGKTRTIVTCSNIIPLKRLDILIDTLSQIENIQIRWVHFGDGSQKEQILQYAEEKLGSKENIKYCFKGYVSNNKIMEFYEAAPVDLFVNCSDVEGIPVSVMEAMAYGIPAIGRQVGGMAELIDNTCGVLLPTQISPEDLTSAVLEILNLPQDVSLAMRQNARTKIQTDFDAERNYRQFFETVKGCLYAEI